MQNNNVTCVHVHNNVWNYLEENTRVSAGSCNNRISLPRLRLADLIKGDIPKTSSESTLMSSVFLFDAVKNETPFDQPILARFRRKESIIRSWGLPKMKGALTAILPSVNFGSSYKKEVNPLTGSLVSAKCSVTNSLRQGDTVTKINPDIWYHTGVFGIDIDLGKDGNPDDPQILREMFENGVKIMGGCILAYNSPSGGIKALFQVREFPREDITMEKVGLYHDAYYIHLCHQIKKYTELSPDMSCKDICRIQYICHSDWVFSWEGMGFNFKTEDAEHYVVTELSESRLNNRSVAIDCIPADQGTPLPQWISVPFLQWMRENDIPDSVYRGLENLRFDDVKSSTAGYKGVCPCCINKIGDNSTSQDTDLMAVIGKEGDLMSVYFTCLHNTCRSHKVISMNDYWVRFLAEWEAKEDLETKVVKQGLYNSNLPPTLPHGNITQGLHRSTLNPIMVRSVNSAGGFPKLGGKNEAPSSSVENIIWFVQNVLGGEILRDEMSGALSFFYKREGGLILSDGFPHCSIAVGDRFIQVLSCLLEKEGVNVNENQIYRALAYMSGNNRYNGFLEWVEEGYNNWDGKDHLSQVLNSITVDQDWDLGSEDMTTLEFTQKVITHWLMGVYVKACQAFHHRSVLPSSEDGVERFYNAMIVFVGGQGAGKTRWIRRLFGRHNNKWVSEVTNFDPANKDHQIQATEKVVLFLDEFDMSAKSTGDNNSLKSTLTKQSVTVRRPYAKMAEDCEMLASYVGATNISNYISDPSGSRRFMSVKIETCAVDEEDTSLAKVDIQQMWGQIRHMVSSNPEFACSWGELEEVSQCNNSRNFVVERDTNYLAEDFVYIPKDMKTPGGELVRKHINSEYTTIGNIINSAKQGRGIGFGNERIPKQEATSFKNALLQWFRVSGHNVAGKELTSSNGRTRIPIMLQGDLDNLMRTSI